MLAPMWKWEAGEADDPADAILSKVFASLAEALCLIDMDRPD